MIKKIDHIVLTTPNLAKCAAFYEQLGFDIRNGGNHLEMFSGDFKINVHQHRHELSPHAKNIGVGSADLCMEVDNLAEFVAMLRSKNIAIELGIVARNGAKGAMQSVYLRDLDGNLLEFCSYE